MDLSGNLRDFHFLRPAWLLAIPLLLGLAAWLARQRAQAGHWAPLIDAQLLPALRLDGGGDGGAAARAPWPWLALAWSLAALALAGPAWEHASSAAFRAPGAWVLVLDLSPSMAAADVAPTRATRARYAIDDLLGAARDARVALVVFSDEPYTVTPLTDDVATVRALLPPLAPDIMPSAGDRLAPALAQAQQLLDQTATRGGHVVVLSDGFEDPAAALAAAGRLRARGASVDVVGIGTAVGAPQRRADGSFEQDAQGHTRMARLDSELLQRLATAGGGRAVGLQGLPDLIAGLQAHTTGDAARVAGLQTARWRDAGAWLLPVVLLLVALLARRRWL